MATVLWTIDLIASAGDRLNQLTELIRGMAAYQHSRPWGPAWREIRFCRVPSYRPGACLVRRGSGAGLEWNVSRWGCYNLHTSSVQHS